MTKFVTLVVTVTTLQHTSIGFFVLKRSRRRPGRDLSGDSDSMAARHCTLMPLLLLLPINLAIYEDQSSLIDASNDASSRSGLRDRMYARAGTRW